MGFIRCNNFHHVGFLYIVLREDVSKGLRLGLKVKANKYKNELPMVFIKNPLRIGLWDHFQMAFLWFYT